MLPLFLMLKRHGAGQHLRRRAGAVAGRRSSASSSCASTRCGIPDELLEAARIDGAGEWRIFFSIVLPLLKPVLVTLAMFTFLGSWNDFMWPLIVLTDGDLHTLPVALAVAVARARAGQRADDGRRGDHDAAGAAAVPGAAALLHAGAADGQRQVKGGHRGIAAR